MTAALTVFADDGLESPPIPFIAKLAGVATGTFYNYFSSRDALIAALNHETEQQIVEFVTTADDSSLSIQDQLLHFMARLLDYFLANRERFFFFFRFHHSIFGSKHRKTRGNIDNDLGYFLSVLLQKGIDEGLLVDLPIDVHFKFCIEVPMALVRDHYLSVQPLDSFLCEQIPQMCLQSILKKLSE